MALLRRCDQCRGHAVAAARLQPQRHPQRLQCAAMRFVLAYRQAGAVRADTPV